MLQTVGGFDVTKESESNHIDFFVTFFPFPWAFRYFRHLALVKIIKKQGVGG